MPERLSTATCNKTVTQTLSAIHATAALLLQMFGVQFGCTLVLDNNELQEER